MSNKGKVIAKKACPRCTAEGGDNSKDNLVIFEDGSFCFKCNKAGDGDSKAGDNDSAESESPENLREDRRNIIKGEYVALTDRGISKETCEKFGVQVGDVNGPVILHNFYDQGVLVDQKVRRVSSKKIQWWALSSKTDKLFGMDRQSPSQKVPVIVTEGEYDAMCIYQETGYPAVSVTRGAGGAAKQLAANLEWLQQWQSVILCFDNDVDGAAATAASIPVFETIQVKVARLPLKDANDMVLAGRGGAIKKHLWDAQVVRKPTIVCLKDIRDKILVQPRMGKPWPWQAMTDITCGIRESEITIVLAGSGIGKCLSPTTPVLMFDGSTKMAKDIQKGDQLMGPDSTPRNVMSTVRGKDKMYRISPLKGDSYVVNSKHILTLQASRTRGRFEKGQWYDIPVEEYLSLGTSTKKHLMTIRTGVEFASQPVEVDPYVYGAWLGDGTKAGPSITNMDPQVLSAWRSYADQLGFQCSKYFQPSKASQLAIISSRDRRPNKFLNFLRTSVEKDSKIIRNEYLINDRNTRLELLAGLLDTDGSLIKPSTFEITQKSKELSDGILFLARSLGFMATCRDKGGYYRMFISGNTFEIPTRIERKKATRRSGFKDVLASGFSVGVETELGDYCGFVIDGDHRFLLGDFQVTHNTEFIKEIVMAHVGEGSSNNVGLFSLEQDMVDTGQRLAAGYIGKPIYVPDSPYWDEKEISDALDKFDKQVYLFNIESGSLSLDRIEITLRFLKNAHNVGLVVIDNLTALGGHPYIDGKRLSPEHYVGAVLCKIQELTRQLKMHVIIAAHTNKDQVGVRRSMGSSDAAAAAVLGRSVEETNAMLSPPGTSWETGRMPNSTHLLGSGNTERLADHVVALARNKEATSDLERRTTYVKFLKTGRKNPVRNGNMFKLLYNEDTGHLEEI